MAALGAPTPRNCAGNGLRDKAAPGLEIGRLFLPGKSVLCGWNPQERPKIRKPARAKRRLFGSNHGA
jgi:hypothetical protein